MRRFRRMMKIMAAISLLVAIIAVVAVAWGTEGWKIHMLIATALGAGLSVFLAAALMSLAFLSSSSGHDEQVSRFDEEEEE